MTQLIIYIFPKVSKYKIAKNSNTDNKLQIIFPLFLGQVGLEDVRKGAPAGCTRTRVRQDLGAVLMRHWAPRCVPDTTPLGRQVTKSLKRRSLGPGRAQEGSMGPGEEPWRGRRGWQRHLVWPEMWRRGRPAPRLPSAGVGQQSCFACPGCCGDGGRHCGGQGGPRGQRGGSQAWAGLPLGKPLHLLCEQRLEHEVARWQDEPRA